jgi:hypothetical protein
MVDDCETSSAYTKAISDEAASMRNRDKTIDYMKNDTFRGERSHRGRDPWHQL